MDHEQSIQNISSSLNLDSQAMIMFDYAEYGNGQGLLFGTLPSFVIETHKEKQHC